MALAVVQPSSESGVVVSVSSIVSQAITAGASVEVLERLLALQERWEATQARKAFDAAMAELRADLPRIVKSCHVDFGAGRAAYQYEDLAVLTEALSPVMAKVGLSFRWRTRSEARLITVTCVVAHRDGHMEETTLSCPTDESGSKNPIQAIGSAVSYLQRYTLKAAVGVAAARDDDGRGGARPADRPASRAAASVEAPVSSTTVREVVAQSGTTKKTGRPWTRYRVTFADGRTGTTFDESVKDRAESARLAGVAVTPILDQTLKGVNLLGFAVAAPTATESPAPPVPPDEPMDGPERVLTVRSVTTDAGTRHVIQTDKRTLVTEQQEWADLAVEARRHGVGVIPAYEVLAGKSGPVNRLTALMLGPGPALEAVSAREEPGREPGCDDE